MLRIRGIRITYRSGQFIAAQGPVSEYENARSD